MKAQAVTILPTVTDGRKIDCVISVFPASAYKNPGQDHKTPIKSQKCMLCCELITQFYLCYSIVLGTDKQIGLYCGEGENNQIRI
jgi:hypothetical protein